MVFRNVNQQEMLFECLREGTKEDPGVSFGGSLHDVIRQMALHQARPGEAIDIVLPFYRIDVDILANIKQYMERFVHDGACIRTLNFDPRKSRGRQRIEHSVLGEAADIGDEGVYSLYLARAGTLSSLESLHLGHCSIEQSGVRYLTKMLASFTNLQELHLSDNEAIGSNFVHLAEQLQFLTNLKDINLTQCSLGSHGAKVLSAILPYMSSLERLHLTYNHISAGSMERVCSQFYLLTNLRMLFLSYNALGNSSSVSKSLHASKSTLSSSGRYLDSGIAFCQRLTHLHVHHCTLGESGVCLLLDSAVSQKLTCLESLRIDHNGVQPNSQKFLGALVGAICALKATLRQLWFRQVGLHFVEKSGFDHYKFDDTPPSASTSGMNDSVARTVLEELVKCERMTFDSTSIDDDILVALAIAFSSLAAPRDWNLKYRERTYLEISKDMFSLTNDWATAGSIKEIFESNIVLHDQIGQGGFGTVYKVCCLLHFSYSSRPLNHFCRRHGFTLKNPTS